MSNSDVLISNVRIQPPERSGELARASLVVGGGMVVKGFSLVRTPRGLEVRMPSSPVQVRCTYCYNLNPVKSKYCSNCAMAVKGSPHYRNGRPVFSLDVAHPLSEDSRAVLEAEIIQAYEHSKFFQGDSGQGSYCEEDDPELRDYQNHSQFD